METNKITVEDIVYGRVSPSDAVAAITSRPADAPDWDDLVKEWDPRLHPVMDKGRYPDKVRPDGSIDYMTRVPIADQQLFAKRMAALMVGTPIYRNWKTEEDPTKQQIADVIESVLKKNRINSVNLERLKQYFGSCQALTVWYAQKVDTMYAGVQSKIKIRCKTYSPLTGSTLFPWFDEYDDMIAFGNGYTRKVAGKQVMYLDFFTNYGVLEFEKSGGDWSVGPLKAKELKKLPLSYIRRDEPIYGDTSHMTYEKEWILSRNGNYIRHNSAPNKVLTTDPDQIDNLKESLGLGKDKSQDLSRDYVLPTGSSLNVVEWQGAVEASKFEIEELTRQQNKILQIPDLSMESLSNISTETMRIALQDAYMKVADESGAVLEFLDREINVIKEFIKPMFPGKEKIVDELECENEIIPYTVDDAMLESQVLSIQTGGKPIKSQEQAVKEINGSNWKTVLKQIQDENIAATQAEQAIGGEPTL